jgi:hypothetical protein
MKVIPEEFMSYVDVRDELMETIFYVEVSKMVQKEKNNGTFNIEDKPKNEEGLNCDNQKDWKEEWLLDSGSMVNLTIKKGCFWNQRESDVTVTIGEGSQVEGKMDGDIIFNEKNSGENLKIIATFYPEFQKSILSVKRLQRAGYMVNSDDSKASVVNKKTGMVAFVCDKGNDGIFYLKEGFT